MKGWISRLVVVLLAMAAIVRGDRMACGEAPAEQLAPLPENVPVPEDNVATTAKVELGKQLFFDERLSGENNMSCATCHLPEKAFADGLTLSDGHQGKKLARNTPGLLNVAFQANFFWDGRATTLEQQALMPIENPDEMHQDLDQLVAELSLIPGYVQQFQSVFGTGVTQEGIAKSLAAFQRTLITGPSPFDRYLQGDEDALSAAAKRGLELFTGDADCIRCHHGPLLTDGQFYRLGVASDDPGLAKLTGKAEDHGKLRTPTLRNVAETAPYMHDGSQRTLSQVVEFYLRGVPGRSTSDLPLDIEPLNGLSYAEVDSLVAFLKSLSGQPPRVEVPDLPQ